MERRSVVSVHGAGNERRVSGCNLRHEMTPEGPGSPGNLRHQMIRVPPKYLTLAHVAFFTTLLVDSR